MPAGLILVTPRVNLSMDRTIVTPNIEARCRNWIIILKIILEGDDTCMNKYSSTWPGSSYLIKTQKTPNQPYMFIDWPGYGARKEHATVPSARTKEINPGKSGVWRSNPVRRPVWQHLTMKKQQTRHYTTRKSLVNDHLPTPRCIAADSQLAHIVHTCRNIHVHKNHNSLVRAQSGNMASH
jgi:hypothetical protein